MLLTKGKEQRRALAALGTLAIIVALFTTTTHWPTAPLSQRSPAAVPRRNILEHTTQPRQPTTSEPTSPQPKPTPVPPTPVPETPRPVPTPAPVKKPTLPEINRMTGAEHVERLRKTTSGREFYPPPEPAGPLTQSPLARGAEPCPLRSPPGELKHTGKRALVLYSVTHRDQGPVHAMEMDNFAFFAQHGLFPSTLRTALFTQVDFVLMRVAATDGMIHDYTRGLNDTNIRIMLLPSGPCDICSTSRILKYLGVDHNSEDYSYVVSINSGTRGPFFSMPQSAEPYTWIDHMALGGRSQFSENVVTAAASSMQWITHFQTYAFGLSTYALKTMGPFFASTCNHVEKDGCIYLGELLSARTAFEASLRVRSLIHHAERSFGDEETFSNAINATGLQSPLLARVVKPCQMLFVKFGGDTFEHSRFHKQYVETLLAQTIAQASVAHNVHVSKDAANLFGRAYFGFPV